MEKLSQCGYSSERLYAEARSHASTALQVLGSFLLHTYDPVNRTRWLLYGSPPGTPPRTAPWAVHCVWTATTTTRKPSGTCPPGSCGGAPASPPTATSTASPASAASPTCPW